MTLTLNSPCDMHLHLRDGAMLENVAPLSSAQFAAAVIMPNLLPPVCTTSEALDYQARIRAVCGESFLPLMSLFLARTSQKTRLPPQNKRESGSRSSIRRA